MRKQFSFILFTFILFACNLTPSSKSNAKSNQGISSYEIDIQVQTQDKEDLEIFEEGIIPWISIEKPQSVIPNLINKDEIVIPSETAIVIVEYPINNPFEVKITADNIKGFSRKELILKISDLYKQMYLEEEQTAATKTIPLNERKGMINRNTTDGKYGIWGHDIGDLDLSTIIVHTVEGKPPKLELYIES